MFTPKSTTTDLLFRIILIAVFVIAATLAGCFPEPASARDIYSSTNEGVWDNYTGLFSESSQDLKWKIRHESALLQVENGSTLTYEEIMDLYYCTDVLNEFNAIGIDCAG